MRRCICTGEIVVGKKLYNEPLNNYHEWGEYGTFIGLYLFSDILDVGARVAGKPQSGGSLFHDQQIATVGAEEIHSADVSTP